MKLNKIGKNIIRNSIVTLVFVLVGFGGGSRAFAAAQYTWTNQATPGASDSWLTTAVSGDGKVMVATGMSGNNFISTDAGATWTKSTLGGIGYPLCSLSGTGSTILCTPESALTNTKAAPVVSYDYGATWTTVTSLADTTRNFVNTVSADGRHMILASADTAKSDSIYVSGDGGSTWTTVNVSGVASNYVGMVALSSGGLIGYAVVSDNTTSSILYKTIDGGLSWSVVSPITSSVFSSSQNIARLPLIVVSSDGQKIFLSGNDMAYGNAIYSLDGGVTWTDVAPAPGEADGLSAAYVAYTMSADGSTVVASYGNATTLYVSTDMGKSWTAQAGYTPGTANGVLALAISANGSTIVTGTSGGPVATGITTVVTPPAPVTAPPTTDSPTAVGEASPVTTSASESTLAATGYNILLPIGGACVLLVVGTIGVVARRLR